MTAIDALEALDNDEIDTLAAGIEAGTVPDDRVERIGELLADVDILEIDDVALEKPAVRDLIAAVEMATDREILPFQVEDTEGFDFEPLDDQAEDAVEAVDRLLQPGAGRDADYFFGLREALEAGDAGFSDQLMQGTLDAIPDSELERLAERADDLGKAAAAQGMTRRDFPDVEDATERGRGRTVNDYWRPLLRELEAGDPAGASTLRDEGVTDEQIEALFANTDVLNEFIEKVENNIDAIRGRSGGGGGGPTITPERTDEGGGAGIDVGDIADTAINSGVRRFVPGRDRVDWLTDETWTASAQQVDLEQRFVNWLFREFGGPTGTRWDSSDLQLRPENRERSMAQWARLQVQAGNTAPSSAIQAGLPEEWFEGL